MKTAQTRFSEGTALVTGGGAGIGEGLARHLAALGMLVVVADIDEQRAEHVAVDIVAAGGRATPYQVDVTDADDVERMAAWVFDTLGGLQLLVNNAGIEAGGRVWEVDVPTWRRVMSINVDGVFHGVKSFVPRLLEQDTPAIIANMSSIGGVTTMPFQAAYLTSKHAVVAMTECLYQDLATTGAPIQVSAILPTWVKSRIFTDAQEQQPLLSREAEEYFAQMLASNKDQGLEPLEAAGHMVEALARGDFWIFSEDDRGHALMAARGEHLSGLTLPIAPGLRQPAPN